MRIRTENFKGRDHELRFGKLTVLTAPNGRGKSTLADAIRFVALGWIPQLGKRLQDSAALLRGRRAEVEIAFDDLHVVRRTLALTEDGGYKSTVNCSWLKKAKSAEHEAEVLRLLGRDVRDVEECLDIRTLLNASPNQRAARLQELLSAASASAEETAAAIAEATVIRLAAIEPDRAPEDYADLLPLLTPEVRANLKGLAPLLLAKLREAGVQAVCDWSNGGKREAAAALKNKTAAAHELRERLAVRDDAAAEDVTRLESERDRLQREIGAVRERVLTADRKRATIEAAARELTHSAEKLDAARARREEVSRDVVAHAGDARRLSEIEAELEALQAPAPVESREATELLAQAAECERKAKAVVLPEATPPRSPKLQAETDALKRQIETAQLDPWQRVREIGLAIELDARGSSERIIRLQAYARELRRLADGHAPDLQALKRQLSDSSQWLVDALEEEREADAGRKEVEHTRADYVREAERYRAAGNELIATTAKAYDDARAAFIARRAPLISERDMLRHGIERRRQDAADADTALARAEEAHKAAEQRAADLGEAPDAVTDDREQLQAELGQVVAKLAEHGRLKAARDELAGLVAELDKAEVQRDVFAALEWAAQQVRARQVTEAGGPLKSRMRTFLQAAGRREEPFFNAAQNQCDIGWITPEGNPVLIQAISGGEWALFATALAAAVIVLRAPTVRILLVEAAEADDAMLAALLKGIAAVSDSLTNALVMTAHDPGDCDGWQIVRLNGQRQAA